MSRKLYHNQIIGFSYRGRVYQWDKYNGEFTPNSSIPKNFPQRFYIVPDEAVNIRISVWEYMQPIGAEITGGK